MSVVAPPPRALVSGVAGGLLLMAVFTMWWASDTFTGWPVPAAMVVTVFCACAAVLFVVQAFRLLIARSRMSPERTDSDRATKPNGALFGAVFAAEGVLIGVAVGILGAHGLNRFLVPGIAVIVGLHFFPMARIFGRTLDLWLATWTTLVGAVGVVVVLFDGSTWPVVWSWVGAGAAAATFAYGASMSCFAQRLLAST
ncbi:hypothetical protein [Rathayibacter iranicus]|uniref:hypothetical protein n=1 Tax=Rathayibacter iranicus TaxID=59737 RepID=UPI000D4B3F42|nr:hypothetical protein [Rathayibacter iranicus]MWV29652.1 hypothetical protein [Rathayibacter iranicus NCPPB 2253 = VKM Ac-1602]PPI68505.1 hypothetical protein C5E01_13815 [Rathayibacter iranicus]